MVEKINCGCDFCVVCDKFFLRETLDQKFCSKRCRKVKVVGPVIYRGKYRIKKICIHCKSVFYNIPSLKSKCCSKRCNYSRGRVWKICTACGVDFDVKRSHKCVRCKICRKEGIRKVKVPQNPSKRTKKCDRCPNTFSYWPSKVPKFCSKECGYESRKKRLVKVCKECNEPFEYCATSKCVRCKPCLKKRNEKSYALYKNVF